MDPRESLTEYRILSFVIAAPVLDTSTVPNPDPLEGLRLQDAGMRVKALSRWNNYYVAGMDLAPWLIVCCWHDAHTGVAQLGLRQIMRDYGADGIYLDV